MSWLEGTRARLRLLFRRRAAESRMETEFRFHVDMETKRLVREGGLDPAEARCRALVAFGGVENYKEAMRSDRTLAWLSGMALDFRLGLRMLVKYPGLAIVGVIGMAVAVGIAAVSFGIIYTIIDPTLPLDSSEQVVAIQNIDTRSSDDGRRTHLHDLATWREGLHAVEILGAYRTIDRNFVTPQGRPEPVRIAEMSASGFRVARVPPLMGRYFSEEDERAGAPPIVVIAHSVWQNRFAGQPDIVGRTVQLGATPHTIIGVMPEGFAFPVNNRIWTPLRLDPSSYPLGDAPDIDVFGRLAQAATLHDARTQLAIIGQRLAATYPATHEYIQPRILPYARAFIDSPELIWMFHLIQLVVSMLLVVIGTNIAILVYARTATRMGEIAVRSALGASRSRIVAQLFAEALVLSTAAAALGLAGAWLALDRVQAIIQRMGGEQLPFWMDFRGISPGLVAYVAGLAVVGAVIVGVLPALRATRRDVHANLQQLSTAGSGMHLGRIWTVLIVTQVATAVVVMPFAISGLVQWVRIGMLERGFASKELLTASLQLDREGTAVTDASALASRFADRKADLVRRLAAEPGVSRVVLMSAMPGDEPNVRIEPERTQTAGQPDTTTVSRGAAGYPVGVSRVDAGFFDAFDIPILLGRGFEAGDVAAGASAVIVNRSFVQKVFAGADPLGRRVRRVRRVTSGDGNPDAAPNAPWYQIVGVVPDFPNPVSPRELQPKLYQPMMPTSSAAAQRSVMRHFIEELQPASAGGDARSVVVAVRIRGAAPATFADRLREVTLEIDPMLRLGNVDALDRTLFESMAMTRFTIIAVALVTLSVLLLSAAGIYALMSFTISRRRREIGIRAALGAGSRSVLWSVLSRAMGQIALGITVGVMLVGISQIAGNADPFRWQDGLLLAGVALLMTIVGLLAAVGPARRALAISPTEALRADG